MKKFNLLLVLCLFSVKVFGLSFNPAQSNGDILLPNTPSSVYLINNSSSNLNLSLSVSGSGFTMTSNRCPAILLPNKSCYVMISINTSILSYGVSSASLMNNSIEVSSLSYNKPNPFSGTSSFLIESLNLSDFQVQTINLINNTSSSKSYTPTLSGVDASKFKIIVNRCQNIQPNKSCTVSLQLLPQVVGSYSATLSEPQLSNAVLINASIGSGIAKPAVNESVSLSPMNIDFGTISKYGQSQSRIVTVTNNGTVSFTPEINLSSNLRLLLNRCQTPLHPAKSCSISISLLTSSSIPDGNLSESLSVKTSVLASPVITPIIAKLQTVPDAPLEPVTDFSAKVAVSDTHSCAVRGGKVYCWGYNFSGQVSLTSFGNHIGTPLWVNSGVLAGKTFTKVAATNQGSCALDDQGSVYCWGRNSYVVGSSSFSGMGIPVKVEGALTSLKVTDIQSGTYKTCALTETFRVFCWGETGYSAWDFGTGASIVGYNTPTQIYTSELTPANPNIVAMSFKGGQSCILDDQGKAYCWGDNYYHQLGNLGWIPDHRTYAMEVDNINPQTFKSISVGTSHSCGITNNNLTYCWGDNTYGQLGNDYNNASSGSVASLVARGPYKQIWSGQGNNCAVKVSDDNLWCWGRNNHVSGFGKLLGYPLTVDMKGPALVGPDGVEGITEVRALSFGEHHTCLMRENQDVYCVGNSNTFGELGVGVDTGYPFYEFRKVEFP